ncbi:MAG TPA: acyl-CoA dehydrogenase family protein [Acidimicrobiales bacterium]|nr:acyl-CoA dehydrogenase family protein [Acidimicrobiales bacterium]
MNQVLRAPIEVDTLDGRAAALSPTALGGLDSPDVLDDRGRRAPAERRAGLAALGAIGRAVNDDPHTGEFRPAAWQRLADTGLWTLPVPRTSGGQGQGWEAFVEAFAAIAGTVDDVGLLLTAIAHAGAIRVLCTEGTEAQRARHLPVLMAGGLGSTAFTEPTGGSDVARIKATATATSAATAATATTDGAGAWRLSGQKAHITNAPQADVIVLLGRLAELAPRDLTLFVLDAGRPGLVLGPAEHMLGCSSSPTGDIVLDEVRVDADDVVGRPGEGLAAAYRMFAFDRALYGLVAAARIQALVDWSLERTHDRHSFGVRLADHQLVQGRIADMYVASSVVGGLAHDAVRAVLRGADDAALTASVAKLYATEQLVAASISALQLHGHGGYEDGRVSRTVADGLGTLIAGGTSDIQRKHIFAQLQHLRGLQ